MSRSFTTTPKPSDPQKVKDWAKKQTKLVQYADRRMSDSSLGATHQWTEDLRARESLFEALKQTRDDFTIQEKAIASIIVDATERENNPEPSHTPYLCEAATMVLILLLRFGKNTLKRLVEIDSSFSNTLHFSNVYDDEVALRLRLLDYIRHDSVTITSSFEYSLTETGLSRALYEMRKDAMDK